MISLECQKCGGTVFKKVGNIQYCEHCGTPYSMPTNGFVADGEWDKYKDERNKNKLYIKNHYHETPIEKIIKIIFIIIAVIAILIGALAIL